MDDTAQSQQKQGFDGDGTVPGIIRASRSLVRGISSPFQRGDGWSKRSAITFQVPKAEIQFCQPVTLP